MSQFNINITPDFEKDLEKYMKKQGLKQKSEAIRRAVHEAVERLSRKKIEYNFKDILGIASQYPQNQHPKFQSEDELWEK